MLGLSSGLLPSGFPTKALYAPLLSPYVLHVLPISGMFKYLGSWVTNTNEGESQKKKQLIVVGNKCHHAQGHLLKKRYITHL
jgi:hypothetical protein